MAKITITGIEAVIKAMEAEADRMDTVVPQAVAAGAAVLEDALRAAAPHRSGGLSASVKAHRVKQHGGEYSSEVYPDGTDKRGERYAKIGFVLEYGRSNMRPRPWVRPTVELVKGDVLKTMEDIILSSRKE